MNVEKSGSAFNRHTASLHQLRTLIPDDHPVGQAACFSN